MTMIVAYDGRQNTEKALDFAIKNASVYGESLRIITILTKSTDSEISRVHEFMDKALEKAIQNNVDATITMESGQPEKVILQACKRFNCSTIIVGRSSKTSFDRIVMGSVSNYVVANAKCTVIVVQ